MAYTTMKSHLPRLLTLLGIILLFCFLTPVSAQEPTSTPQTPTANRNATIKSNVACTKVGNPEVSMPAACSTSSAGGFPSFSGEGNVVYYCQGNPEWSNTCALGAAGCGTTSMAMVLSSFGVTMTPPQVDAEWGFRACGNVGSSMQGALSSGWLKSKGFESGPGLLSGSSLDLQLAKQFLDDKWLIIASSRSFPCANCKTKGTPIDHIFVVSGVDAINGKVDIRDPNNCSYANGNDEDQSNRIKGVGDFPWLYAIPVRRIP